GVDAGLMPRVQSIGPITHQPSDLGIFTVAFARIHAHCLREHGNADPELRRHLIEHRVHNRGHARHHDYIADPEARRPRHLVEDEIRALGDLNLPALGMWRSWLDVSPAEPSAAPAAAPQGRTRSRPSGGGARIRSPSSDSETFRHKKVGRGLLT